jgi:hypothetical protein
MITERLQTTRVQPRREYPTEWTLYDAREEEDVGEGRREVCESPAKPESPVGGTRPVSSFRTD